MWQPEQALGVPVKLHAEQLSDLKGAVLAAVRAARDGGFASDEDQIVVTAGVPFNVKGTTNILRVAPCDERLISRVDPE